MIRKYLINIVFLLFFSIANVYGERLHLSTPIQKEVQVKPGKVCSILYKLDNDFDEQKTVSTRLILPDNWQVVTFQEHQVLAAHESKTGLFSFRVPEYTTAGQYVVSYEIAGISDKSPSTSFDVMVKVKEVVELSMELVSSIDHVVAGNQASASFIVRNEGNSPQTVLLEGSNCLINGNNTFQLDPGASRIVRVNAKSPDSYTRVASQSFRITARVSGQEEVFTDLFHNYKVIPIKEPPTDLFFRFPVEVSLRYIFRNYKDDFHSGFQGQIYGNGFLDMAKTKQLTFLARGPDQFNLSVLGMYDQYYVAYHQKEFSVFIGDKTYRLSPLTEMSRYGRGAEGQLRIKRVEIGSFYQQPRFYPGIRDEMAGYINVRFYKENAIGISYLRKRYSENSEDAHLFSLRANLKPFANTVMDVELSKGFIGDKSDYGFYTAFIGNWGKVNVSATVLYAGKDYPGYYTNSLFYTVMANWRITKRLNVSLNARQDFKNAVMDTLYGTAPYNQGYYIGAGYIFKNDITLRLYYDYKERIDRAVKKKFHYREHVVRLYYSHDIRRFNYSLNAEVGKTENILITSGNRFSDAYRLAVDLYYRIGDRIQLSAMGSFMSNNRYTETTQNLWVVGGSISGRISNKLYLFIRYQSDYEVEEYYRDRSIFTANIDWYISRNHKLSAIGNYALVQKQLDLKDYSAGFTYTYRFGVPLKRMSEAGSISGKINNISAKSIEGIILNLNGHSVITGQDGSFTLNNLAPGNYFLLIDRSTVEFDELPDIQTPIEVEVKAGEETFITFGMTTAAKVKGKIEVENGGKQSKILGGDDDVGHLILELTNDEESIKIISDEKGEYIFPLVRPGEWQLKVYPNGLAKNYRLEKENFQLELKQGEQIDIPIKLIKKKRNIIFVNNKLDLTENIIKIEKE
jgi:hypothetical protein